MTSEIVVSSAFARAGRGAPPPRPEPAASRLASGSRATAPIHPMARPRLEPGTPRFSVVCFQFQRCFGRQIYRAPCLEKIRMGKLNLAGRSSAQPLVLQITPTDWRSEMPAVARGYRWVLDGSTGLPSETLRATGCRRSIYCSVSASTSCDTSYRSPGLHLATRCSTSSRAFTNA